MNKIEDSKWILNDDSLVMGIRKQWLREKSFFSIDVAQFSDNNMAQKAMESNSSVKRIPVCILGDTESIKEAVEEWSLNWLANDSIKYISMSSRINNYAIQFYYFDEYGIDIEFFNRVLSNFKSTGLNTPMMWNDRFSFQPNPSTGFITITVPPDSEGKYRLRLTNMQGQVLQIKEEEITGSYQLDLSVTKPGIYILEIKGETSGTSKLIVLQ